MTHRPPLLRTPFRGRLGGLWIAGALIAALQAACSFSTGSPPATAKRVAPASSTFTRGTGGAVATGHPEATAAGLEALRAGGNAIDAAVTAALVLAVTFPEAGNLGGGGFAVIKRGDEVTSLDFRETAPVAANREMYLDPEGEPIPNASLVGPLAAGVPGSPSGLFELHRRFGSLAWERIVTPALTLAAEGFTVDENLHETIAYKQDVLARFPETAAVWLPAGRPPAIETVLRQPDLAATLRAYRDQGPRGILEGPVAAAVEEASRRHGGRLTAADLAAYEPVWREPVRFRAYGWEMASMSLPSSGGIILGQTLGLLERLGWAELPRGGGDRAHLLAETWRRVFADRFLLGDPETTAAAPEALLAEAWLDQRAKGVDRDRAGVSTRVRPYPGDGTSLAGAPPDESSDTTHLSVIDSEGSLVALTTTINGLFGCGLYVPGAGFFLNNEMDDFAAAPGRPNLFGLIQGEANAVRAGRRMLSSMTPTLVWNKQGEALVLGGRGGSRIPTGTTQVLLNVIVDGDDLAGALAYPRLHHQWLPDRLEMETGTLSAEAAAEIRHRGHQLKDGVGMGKVHAVRRRADGTVEAGGDPRGPHGAGVVDPDAAASATIGAK